MYRTLKGEIIKKGLSIKYIAKSIGISERTLRNKINGLTDFTWVEVCKIQSLFFPQISKDELFTKSA